MGIRKKSVEQELKGVGQKAKGLGQEVVGRVTGDQSLRARGEANQVGGTVRSKLGEAGRRISDAVDREKSRSRGKLRAEVKGQRSKVRCRVQASSLTL